MEVSKLLLALLGFSCVSSAPQEDYRVNAAYPDQGFYYSYQLQPRSTYFYPTNINKPEYYPELGMSPQYHDLVYDYVKDFAGTQPPPHADTFQPFMYNADNLAPHGGAEQTAATDNSGVPNPDNGQEETPTQGAKEEYDHKPFKDYFLPSDYLSLPNDPKSQFYGRLDAIKMKRINPKAHPTSLPPIGGVISNYILSREQKPPQNLAHLLGNLKDADVDADLQQRKRQTLDSSDGVEILAEPSQGSKATEETKEEPDGNKEEEEQMAAHPGIAQSKPSAIALAGPGGMAQASPVGTALVGQGGLAVAAPSGTAVAGPAGGSIPIHIGGEKQRKETTEKSEESADAF